MCVCLLYSTVYNSLTLIGTGSGSLTHALIRRVRPHGHVYTFDFHEHRAKVASEEFQAHGIAEFVTVSIKYN